jgi:hypothetical protein
LDQPTGRGQQAVDVSAGAVLWPSLSWDVHGWFVTYFTA